MFAVVVVVVLYRTILPARLLLLLLLSLAFFVVVIIIDYNVSAYAFAVAVVVLLLLLLLLVVLILMLLLLLLLLLLYRTAVSIRFDSFSFHGSYARCCNTIKERRRSVRLMRYFRIVVVAAAAVALTVLASFTGMYSPFVWSICMLSCHRAIDCLCCFVFIMNDVNL